MLTAIRNEIEARWRLARATGVKAFVFVATTGRSGSNTLERLLAGNEGCVALHEPAPVMAQRDVDGRYCVDTFGWQFRHAKRLAILRAADGARFYVETNHQFIKSFAAEALAFFGPRLRVIHLRRDAVEVAESFQRIRSIPGRTSKGRRWLIDPDRRDNLVSFSSLVMEEPAVDSDLGRCLWYWYETEARVARFRHRFPHVGVARIATQQLNQPAAVAQLLRELNMEELTSAVLPKVGVRVNTKPHHGRIPSDVVTTERLNERMRTLVTARFCGDICDW